MSRVNAGSIAEIIANPQPDDWVVEVLVRVGDGKPYARKVVNVTPDPSRENAIRHALRTLGLDRAKPGEYVVKSAGLRRDMA